MALTMESLGMLLLLLLTVSNLGTASEVICAYTQRDPVKEMTSITDKESEVAVPVGEILPDNKTMRCPKSTDFCYALWSEDPQNKSLTNFLAQGCWESSGGYDCEESECFSNKKPPKALNSAKFCCCQGLLCNVNVSDVYVPSSEPDIGQTAHPFIEPVSHKKEAIVIIVAIGCSLFAIFFILFLVYRLLTGLHKPNPDSLHLMEAPPPIPTTPTYDLSTLKLQEVIGRGRYGSVWRANLCDRDVAVKVFQQQHKLYYLNEKDIYTLPHLEHPCLLKFLGSEERVNGEGRTEYLIVLSYAPLGCLQDYLRNQTIDWPTLCKMSQSLAKGLAHLHTDVRKGDKVKPCITHRDLNSRNILVKLDLNCAICDMGFAMKIAGSKYYGQNGEEQYAETTSLTDVGTLRYMAPEVLEGAVNLRDCESSLKQIDVYALGLVLWEIMTRCSDLYQGLEVPEYRLPFEAEIGLHPTFEQMQVLISRNKARPLFSEVWKDSNQAVRLLKETIEDCWDQDAEARLTSLCVEERLQELPALWERHRVSMTVTGVSPTVNPTSSQLSTMRNSAINNNSTLSSTPANHELTDRNGNIPGIISLADTIILQNRDHGSFYYQQNRESSISEATAETTVTMSPSEPSSHPPQDNLTKNANTQQSSWLSSIPLQPYQGRNPCLERNMIMEPQEEISISGNTLLEKGSKYKNIASVPINRDVDVENIFDVLQLADNVESNSLVSNDVLNHSTRTCNPIPYVQNAVHGTLPARPKQPNVPGNGQHYDKKVRKGPFGGRFDKKKSSSGEQSGKKVKDWCIKTLLDRKRISRSNHSIDNNAVISNEGNVANTSNGHHRSMSDGTQNVGKSNLAAKNDETSKPVTTEVCLLQNSNNEPTQIVIRPTNGPYKSVENGYLSNGNCRTAEVGVAKLALTNLQNGQAPILKCRSSLTAPSQTNSLDHHSNLDPANSDVESKALRPTTLPIKGHNFRVPSNMQEMMVFNSPKIRTSTEGSSSEKAALLKDYDEMDDSNPDDPKGKIARRVKTPFEIKPGRFSLCDDRMMSHGDECHHHFSLNSPLHYKRGCVSIPVDIDAVCTQLSVKFANDLRTKPADCKQTENQEIAADKMLTEKFAAAPHPPNTDFRSCVNGTVIPNGTIPSLWSTPNHNDSQNKNSEPTNKGVYRVSCL